MRRVCIFLLALCFADTVSAQYQTQDSITKSQILRLISMHPDLELRSNMTKWYSEGKYVIVPDPTVPALAFSNYYEAGKPNVTWPGLRVNPDFFITTTITVGQQRKDPRAIQMHKFGG